VQAFLQNCNGEGDCIMMMREEERKEWFTAAEIRYLKVAIALALGSDSGTTFLIL
jgi:hypothetical protein